MIIFLIIFIIEKYFFLNYQNLYFFLKNKKMEIQTNYDQLTNKIQRTTEKIATISENVHQSTLLIGFTGSGKSTLVSTLLNAPLKFQRTKKGGTYIIDHNDLTGKYPKIGHTNISCTEIPDIFQVNGKYFADLTGFVETRGLDQEIVNGFSNSCMFQKGKKIKIIIVLQIACLTVTRGDPVVAIAQRMFDLFQQDFQLVINSTLLVVSKVDTNDWDQEYIGQVIEDITLSNKNLTPSTIRLLNSIVRNKRIAIFPHPDKIINHIQMIKNKINLIQYTILRSNGKVSLSPQAVNKINSYIYQLVNNLKKSGKDIALTVKTSFSTKEYQNVKNINDDLCVLKKVKVMLQTQTKRVTLYSQGMSLMNELTQNLKVNGDLTAKTMKIFTMIQFYRCLNSQIDVQSNFIEVICMEVNQAIGILSLKLQKMTSKQERDKMTVQHQRKMEERQMEFNEKIKKAQKSLEEFTKKSQQDMQKQNEQFKQLLNQKDKRNQQYQEKMQRQLVEIRRRQPQVQVVHVKSKKKGGFFGAVTNFIGGVTNTLVGMTGVGKAAKVMMSVFK